MQNKNSRLYLLLLVFLTACIVSCVFASNTITLLYKSVVLSWENNVFIEASKFSRSGRNSCLRITYTLTSADYHKIKAYSVSDKWHELGFEGVSGAAFVNGELIPEKNTGIICISLSKKELGELKKGGFVMHGHGVEVSKVDIAAQDKNKETVSSEMPAVETRVPVVNKGTPFAEHGALHVDGAYLYDSHNKKVQLFGMSTHGMAWYPQYVCKETFTLLRDDWKTNCVRLALYTEEFNGYMTGGNQQYLMNLVCDGVKYATELGMYVIIDWHVLAFNPQKYTEDAKKFFAEVSSKFASYDNVIYEICNEPTNSDWNSAIRPYAMDIIPVIRSNSPDAVIAVGTNTWSQDIDKALENPITEYKNIMYSFHFYANSHTQSMRDRVENCINSGLPVFITEFGTCDASGNGGFNVQESEKWFDLMQKYNISHMNWAMGCKDETACIIRPNCKKLSAWTDDDLTQSGVYIREHFIKTGR